MVDGRIPGSTRRRLLVSIGVALAGFGSVRVSRRHLGQGWQSQRCHSNGRQPVRGAAQARISVTSDADDVCADTIRRSRALGWLPSVSVAVRESLD